MAQQAVHLIDHVFPDVPIRQWVLTVPFPLRPMVSLDRQLQSKILKIFMEEIFRVLRERYTDQVAAVSVIQRFGNALNLHAHYHVLVVDGRWREDEDGQLQFEEAPPLSSATIQNVSHRVADRVLDLLRRMDRLDGEHPVWLDAPTWPVPASDGEAGWLLSDHTAIGSAPGHLPPPEPSSFESAGFSIHAAVRIDADDIAGRERLCRYVTRPSYASEQVAWTADGRISFRFAKPKRTGETHIFFTPNQFLRRLTSQIPPLGQNLVRYHGAFAPAARRRKEVVRETPPPRPKITGQQNTIEIRSSWAAMLSRVYEIDILECPKCSGRLKIIASIQERSVIDRILRHLDYDDGTTDLPSEPVVVYDAGAG